MERHFFERGFLPPADPLRGFPSQSPLAVLDEWGADLPSRLEDPGFRAWARGLSIPPWTGNAGDPQSRLEMHLYYVRVGFLASAYINQVGQEPERVLPRNIATPLVHICQQLGRPPILSYDGYALYNWKRFDPAGPIALGNIDTLQDFVHLYDEHWFILVHVEIEALAGSILAAMVEAREAVEQQDSSRLSTALARIGGSVWRQVAVLKRIPEKMDPAIYFRTFRPYIRFFDDVVYEGVIAEPMSYRGETGAQSTIIPALVAFMKIPHRPSMLTNHLADMQQFMPPEHRAVLAEIQAMPDVQPLAEREVYNDLLEAIATFREVHFGWAHEYIHKRVRDPLGTGGTPFMQWLGQLIDETRAKKIA